MLYPIELLGHAAQAPLRPGGMLTSEGRFVMCFARGLGTKFVPGRICSNLP